MTLMSGNTPPIATGLLADSRAVSVSDFGDAAAEYRAVREAVGISDRQDLVQLRLTGRDPVKMLHGLISNDLAGATSGRAVYAAMLNPKGKMIADLRAFSRTVGGGTEVRVVVPEEALTGTIDHLKKFIPPMFARSEVLSDSEVIGVYGPLVKLLLEKVTGGQIPEIAEDELLEIDLRSVGVLGIGTRYVGGEAGFDLLIPPGVGDAVRDILLDASAELGGRRVGTSALEALRIEAGQPRYGRELTEATIPTEAYESTGSMARAISFTKGCYTGQEVIVRIAHRGHVNRALRGLRLGQLPVPAMETELFAPESLKPVGRITSAAESPLLGETIALGYLRREVVPGDRVMVGSTEGAEALVTDLPFRREP